MKKTADLVIQLSAHRRLAQKASTDAARAWHVARFQDLSATLAIMLTDAYDRKQARLTRRSKHLSR